MLQTIKSKITVFTSIIIIIAMASISVLVYKISNDIIKESLIRSFHDHSKITAIELQTGIIKIAEDLSILSKTPPIQGIIRSYKNNGDDPITNSNLELWKKRLATIFTSMLKVNKNYTQIRYLGVHENGKEIVRVNRVNDSIYITTDDKLQGKGNRDYFKESIKLSQGGIYFSDINYNKENGKVQYPLVATMRVLAPIYSEQQELFGVLAINVNITRYLRDIFNRTDTLKNFIVYNKFGDYLTFDKATDTTKYFADESEKNDIIEFLGKEYLKEEFIKEIKNNLDMHSIELPIYSNNYQDDSPLTLVTLAKSHDLFLQGSIEAINLIFWVFIICALSIFSIHFIASKITVNLSKLANDIKKYKSTEKKLNLPIHLNDEVGLLARAFQEKTQQLKKIAMYDSLTGLPNRKNLIDHLDEAIFRARRSNKIVALGFVDLNNFKQVNDTYGHSYGDSLLTTFATTIRKTVRDTDFVARLGGDEFAILAENIESNEDVKNIFTRFSNNLNKNYSIKSVTINLLVSIGVALYPEHASDYNELLTNADIAMYLSKQEGLGHVHIFSPDQDISK